MQYENHFQIEGDYCMNIGSKYNTKQKDKLISYIKSKNEEFTIKEIYEDLNKKIGLTTIYRLVNNLLEKDKLKKYVDKDNKTHYQYLEECNKNNHFYLKCSKCKKMIHIDCKCIKNLSNHILKEHDFKLNKSEIVIDGICLDCTKKKEGYYE